MTFATQITVARIFLVPVFAYFAVRYGQTVATGAAEESLRWWAVAVFTIAAVSDGIDGFVARYFNQKSKLGALLDPIADKALLLTALLILSLVEWGEDWSLPLWFVVLVIARDIFIFGGINVLYYLKVDVPIKPHWSGKICTVTQMFALGWVMLKWIPFSPLYPTILAAIFTIYSGIAYYRQGYRQLPKNQPSK